MLLTKPNVRGTIVPFISCSYMYICILFRLIRTSCLFLRRPSLQAVQTISRIDKMLNSMLTSGSVMYHLRCRSLYFGGMKQFLQGPTEFSLLPIVPSSDSDLFLFVQHIRRLTIENKCVQIQIWTRGVRLFLQMTSEWRQIDFSDADICLLGVTKIADVSFTWQTVQARPWRNTYTPLACCGRL